MPRPARCRELAGRRRVRGDRPCAGGRAVRRQAQAEAERLSVDGAGFDQDRRARRVCRRRRDRRHLSPGGDRGGAGLHGGARGGKIPGRDGSASRSGGIDRRPASCRRERGDFMASGLGQATRVSRRGGGGLVHPCRREAAAVAIGDLAAGQRARAGCRRAAVQPPCARPGADRAGRDAVSHRA